MTETDDTGLRGGRIAWHCACFNVRQAARAVTEYYDDILVPSGLKAPQFITLGAIFLHGPITISGLAEMISLDRTTLTRNLKLLEKDGLVTIAVGEDRRARLVALTEAGSTAVEHAMPLWRTAQSRVEETFGETRWRALLDDLATLTELSERQPSAQG